MQLSVSSYIGRLTTLHSVHKVSVYPEKPRSKLLGERHHICIGLDIFEQKSDAVLIDTIVLQSYSDLGKPQLAVIIELLIFTIKAAWRC